MTYEQLQEMAEFLEEDADAMGAALKTAEEGGQATAASLDWIRAEIEAAQRVAKRFRETLLAEAPNKLVDTEECQVSPDEELNKEGD